MPRKKTKKGSGLTRQRKGESRSGETRPKQNVLTKKERKAIYDKNQKQKKEKKVKVQTEAHDVGVISDFEHEEKVEDDFESPTKSALKREIQKLKGKIKNIKTLKQKFEFEKEMNEKNLQKLENEKSKRQKAEELHACEISRFMEEIEHAEKQIDEVKKNLG